MITCQAIAVNQLLRAVESGIITPADYVATIVWWDESAGYETGSRRAALPGWQQREERARETLRRSQQ